MLREESKKKKVVPPALAHMRLHTSPQHSYQPHCTSATAITLIPPDVLLRRSAFFFGCFVIPFGGFFFLVGG